MQAENEVLKRMAKAIKQEALGSGKWQDYEPLAKAAMKAWSDSDAVQARPFTLPSNDPLSSTVVRVWALLKHRAGGDDKAITEALACAKTMDAACRESGDQPAWSCDKSAYHIEHILFAATSGMDCHPDNYDHACDCDTCLSYD